MKDSFDKFYENLSKECNKEKVCERCCAAQHNIESEVRKLKQEYSFDEECRKICRSVKKIMKGKPEL